MYFITTKRMLEVCFFQHTPTFIIEPFYVTGNSVEFPVTQKARTCQGCAQGKTAGIFAGAGFLRGCF